MNKLIRGNEIVNGVHYAPLNHVRWKYALIDDLRVDGKPFDLTPPLDLFWQDRKLASIGGGFIIVYKGYAWDGASGGCPDNKNMMASLLHDVLYQASRCASFPHTILTREVCDKVFRDYSFHPLRDVFYRLLRVGGWPNYGNYDPNIEIHRNRP